MIFRTHYFGQLANLVVFSEVKLPNVGTIDFVLVRHKPMRAEVEDFIPVEFQSDSTTGTGSLVQSLKPAHHLTLVMNDDESRAIAFLEPDTT